MLLIRATKLTPAVVELAERLAAETDLPVGYIVDGRYRAEADTRRPAIELTRSACEPLGLFCPDDFAWRCGDYGLYLARRRWPEMERFWLFEYDVNWAGPGLSEFFSTCERRTDVDLLATHLRPATPDWAWYGHARGLGVRPYRCFFPLIRLSARALDALLAKRLDHSRRKRRVWDWPNDEAFTATTLTNGPFRCCDLRELTQVYDASSFSWEGRRPPEDLPRVETGVQFFHPVGRETREGEHARGPRLLPPKVLRQLGRLRPW